MPVRTGRTGRVRVVVPSSGAHRGLLEIGTTSRIPLGRGRILAGHAAERAWSGRTGTSPTGSHGRGVVSEAGSARGRALLVGHAVGTRAMVGAEAGAGTGTGRSRGTGRTWGHISRSRARLMRRHY